MKQYESSSEEDIYNVKIFRVTHSKEGQKELISRGDFKAQMVINSCLDNVLADTGPEFQYVA